ncbi:MAG TPA: nucleoside triphosphate pyrophosphatase [Anaerolineae bacterium]|jgi:MAF protein|nr:nucleoside triphosphate pyrophosphatase [Anaerolineae bacterium]
MELILASASPRRQELIQLLGLPWRVVVAEVDEESISHPDPAQDVIQTARLKAADVVRRASEKAVVVAADTTVVLDGRRLNKPSSEVEAREMLRQLRGRTHHVHTGIVVVDVNSDRWVTDVATVEVPMRAYSEAELVAYVATGDPLDKAGAYAIQHPEFRPVVGLTGCYAGVVGLPLCHLTRALTQVGVDVRENIASACQAHHDYDCPIFGKILGHPSLDPE